MERTGDNQYSAKLTAGVGPVKGVFTATVSLADITAPSHYKLVVEGKGQPGFVKGAGELNLTEDGDRFLASVTDGVESIQPAIVDVTTHSGKPALKVSVALTFGLDHVLPFLPAFMKRYPDVQLDWSFENRQVDLIGEGFDAAIGGGMN